MDYDFRKRDFTKAVTLAGAFPLFFKLAPKPHSHYVRGYLRLNFLRSGWVTYNQHPDRATVGCAKRLGAIAMDRL
jgi:hypothetical protein